MKKLLLFTLLAVVSACGVTWAQDSPELTLPDQPDENYEAPLYPTTGVRFVVCSPLDRRLPSPLYALYKDKYMPIYISSRGPSERVLPGSDGHIRLYEKDPGDAEDPGKPFLDITLPQEARKGRVICLVMLGAKKTKPKYFYIRESELPVGGFYVLNLSPVTIEIVYVTKPGKYPDKGKRISPFRQSENNCISRPSSYVWDFTKKDNPDVKTLEYLLRVPAESEDGTPMPLRGSKFAMSEGSAYVIIVVQLPSNENPRKSTPGSLQQFRLISFSYSNEADKRNEANASKANSKAPRGGQRSSTPR